MEWSTELLLMMASNTLLFVRNAISKSYQTTTFISDASSARRLNVFGKQFSFRSLKHTSLRSSTVCLLERAETVPSHSQHYAPGFVVR